MRYNRVYMHARQRIYKRGGGWIVVRTGARLRLKFAHLSRFWWKFFNAARFELWRVDGEGKPHRRCAPARRSPTACATSPTRGPGLRGTPYLPHYPACSTNISLRQRHARHLGRLGRHLPAQLPGAVDRRDRAARLLRLRAHRRPRERRLRVQRGQQRGAGDRAAAVPARRPPPRLPRPRPRATCTTRASTPGCRPQPVGPKRSVRTCSGSKPLSSSSPLADSTNPFEPHTNAVPPARRRLQRSAPRRCGPYGRVQPAGGSRV